MAGFVAPSCHHMLWVHMVQAYDSAAEIVAALDDGSLKVCDVHSWAEPTYNSLVSSCSVMHPHHQC